jgi:hypothetical protein
MAGSAHALGLAERTPRLRSISIVPILLLALVATAYAQSPAPVARSQATLDYFAIVKRDRERTQQYLDAVTKELVSFAGRFEGMRARGAQLIQQGKAGEADSPLRWLEGDFERFDDSSGLSSLRTASKRFEEQQSGIARVLAERTPSDANSVSAMDGAETSFEGYLEFAANSLWRAHVWEATWELQFLNAEISLKFASVDSSHRGEVDAIYDALDADYRSIGCLHIHYRDDCPERIYAAEGDFYRKLNGVCWARNDEIARYLLDVVGHMQAIADRLRQARSRVMNDFRGVIERIEQDKGGDKVDIYASADRALQRSVEVVVVGTNTGFRRIDDHLFAYVLEPSPTSLSDHWLRVGWPAVPKMPACEEWPEQMPADLRVKFPSVAVEFFASVRLVTFGLVFDQSQVIEGVAEGRAADDRP